MKSSLAKTSWNKRALLVALYVGVAACGSGSDSSDVPTSGTSPAPAPVSSPAPTPGATPAPTPSPPPAGALDCPAPVVVPRVAACDGVLLTDVDSASFRSPGIVASAGPAGAAAWKIGANDDDHILIKDTPCLRLGKDGTDFSLSMWLKMSGDSQIIGTGDGIGSGTPGFSITSRLRDDGLIELVLGAGKMHYEEKRPFNDLLVSAPFKANEWVHVVLAYDSNGPGKASTFSMWFNLSTTPEPARSSLSRVAPIQVYQPNLKIGDRGYGRWAPFEVSEMRSYSRVLTTPEIKALALDKAGVAGLSLAELKQSTDRLLAHVNGTAVLQPAAFGAEVTRFEKHSSLLDTDAAATQRALELVATWEAEDGPLFMGSKLRVSASAKPGEAGYPALAMLKVQQAAFDHAYSAASVQHCASTLDKKPFLTSQYFPGSVATTPDVSKEHRVSVNATVPAFWGRPEAYSADPVVRATGLYLSPGAVAEVRVPDSMVGAGFEVRVGAHIGDHGHKSLFSRLPRVSKTFPITSSVTRIANPLGGGVYLMVPYLADKGMQTVTVRGGVVEAPFFSARGFDKTTNAQWLARRTAPAPWADFESDKFMMQVPSSWIYAFDDPVALMEKWDRAMDGFSEVQGYKPEQRNRVVMYQLVDTDIQWGVYGVGYPMTNNPFNPATDKGNGNRDHMLLRDPLAWATDFHELGHSSMHTMFSGETEAIVNFPYAYIRSVKFGFDFADSFSRSMGAEGENRRISTPDGAAVQRMTTDSFRQGQERNKSDTEKDEVRYQPRGYAHYADIARTFGWEAYLGFLRQEHLDWMNPPPSDGLSGDDSRALRMSVAAKTDLTPLFHFWGIHPDDPVKLKAAMVAKGLTPSPKVKTLLERYYTLIPRNNAEYLAFLGGLGVGCGPNESLDYGCGYWSIWRAKYGAAEGTQAQAALQAIIKLYYP